MIIVKEALDQVALGKDFDSIVDVLRDLTPEQAVLRPHPKLSSIATVVWHMWFWNDRWVKQVSDVHCEPFSEEGSDFREIELAEWVDLRDRFFTDFQTLRELSNHVNVFTKPTQYGDSVEVIFLRAALHSAYHVGQIVQLRTLI